MESDPNPLRELIGLVDREELETVRKRSDAFRNDVTDRFRDRVRTDERE